MAMHFLPQRPGRWTLGTPAALQGPRAGLPTPGLGGQDRRQGLALGLQPMGDLQQQPAALALLAALEELKCKFNEDCAGWAPPAAPGSDRPVQRVTASGARRRSGLCPAGTVDAQLLPALMPAGAQDARPPGHPLPQGVPRPALAGGGGPVLWLDGRRLLQARRRQGHLLPPAHLPL